MSNEALEKVLIGGDLAALSPQDRMAYYSAVCRSLGLNPLTRPFDYIELWDSARRHRRLTLYAKKDATDQLRKLHGISIPQDQITTEMIGGVFVVRAAAQSADGRTDTDVGAAAVEGLQGESLANAIMKAYTKAKRRVTLSICGLGWLDETEIDSIPHATASSTVAVAASNSISTDSQAPLDAQRISELCSALGRTPDQLDQWCARKFKGRKLSDLRPDERQSVIQMLERTLATDLIKKIEERFQFHGWDEQDRKRYLADKCPQADLTQASIADLAAIYAEVQ
jgi:hypothetical protein